jgi:hypothetical protein
MAGPVAIGDLKRSGQMLATAWAVVGTSMSMPPTSACPSWHGGWRVAIHHNQV